MLWKSTISKKMMAKPEEREFRKESVFLIYDPLKVAVKSSQHLTQKLCAPFFKVFSLQPSYPLWILVACEIDFRKDLPTPWLVDSCVQKANFHFQVNNFPLKHFAFRNRVWIEKKSTDNFELGFGGTIQLRILSLYKMIITNHHLASGFQGEILLCSFYSQTS